MNSTAMFIAVMILGYALCFFAGFIAAASFAAPDGNGMKHLSSLVDTQREIIQSQERTIATLEETVSTLKEHLALVKGQRP
jgi:hypothetical protein